MFNSPILLLAEALLSIFLVLGAYSLRRRFSLGFFYAAIAFVLVLLWSLPQDLGVQVGSLRFLIPSSILFSSLLVGAFVSYIFDGPRAGRVSIGVILGGTILFSMTAQLLRFHGHLIDPSAAPLFPEFNLRSYIASVTATFSDLIFLTVVWELLNRVQRRVPLLVRVILALLAVMWLDVLVFITIAFMDNPAYWAIIQGNLVTRLVLALVTGPLLTAYMLWEIKRYGTRLESRPVLAIFLEENLEQKLQVARNDVAKGRVALQESEDRYRATVEDLPLMICRFLPDGSLTYANNAFCRYFQLSLDEVAGRLFNRVIPAEKHASLERFLLELTSGKPTGSIELEVSPEVGTTGSNRWSVRALFDQDDQLVAFLGIGEDVTRERALENQLNQSQKMEAVGRLAGGVAHDFNNILTAIFGNCELSRSSLDTKPHDLVMAREGLREIERASERAAAMVKQLLIFSRKDQRQAMPLNLNDVLVDMHKMLQRIIGENITLELECDPNLELVQADKSQLEQVVMNLVINSGDAMPDGGVVKMKTSNLISDPKEFSAEMSGVGERYIFLEVSDTGFGMDKETLDRIFEPFFTTKAPDKGTGLGLSTTFGIINRAGGNIQVTSQPGQGCTIQVMWPAMVPAESTELTKEADPCPQTEHKAVGNILVCEDDIDVRYLTVKYLCSAGYEVFEAGNGPEALAIANNPGLDLAILVTDVIMPGMNGRELSEELTRQFPTLKTLFVSGYSGQILGDQGVLVEKINFLAKPYTKGVLLDKVRQILDA